MRDRLFPLLFSLALCFIVTACPPPEGDDAGPSDAGAPPADAGTEDAGDDDAGTRDAGGDDAGPSDAGAGNAGSDGGTEDPCATATYDPVLGTLSLENGFVVVESASVPQPPKALAVRQAGEQLEVLGVDDVALQVFTLGTWPNLGAPTVVFDLVPDDEAAETVYASFFLATDGARLVGGYTLLYDFTHNVAPGKIAIYDPSLASSPTTWVTADGNFSAAFFEDALLVNGTSLGTVADGAGVYALEGSAGAYAAQLFAGFPGDWQAANGHLAVTSHGVAVVGAFFADGDEDARNHLFAVPPAQASAVLTNDVPIDLGAAVEISDSAFRDVSAFGEGVAVLKGSFFGPLEGVVRIPLSVEASDGGAGEFVVAGSEAPVLSVEDGCTSLGAMAPMGTDLLVSVADANGSRLLRIRPND